MVTLLAVVGCASANGDSTTETPIAVASSPVRETVVVRETVLVTVPPQQATVLVRETVVVTASPRPATATITPSPLPPTATPEPTLPPATATLAPTAIPATATTFPTAVPPPATAVPTVPPAVPTPPVSEADAAAIALYRTKGCNFCHTLTVAGATGQVGPTHNGIGTTALARIADPAYTGSATTAYEYIRESIINPGVYATAGYSPNVMPSFADTSDEFLEPLIQLLLAQK